MNSTQAINDNNSPDSIDSQITMIDESDQIMSPIDGTGNENVNEQVPDRLDGSRKPAASQKEAGGDELNKSLNDSRSNAEDADASSSEQTGKFMLQFLIIF